MAWLRTSRPVDALDGRLESRCVRNGCEKVIGRFRSNRMSPSKALGSKLDSIDRKVRNIYGRRECVWIPSKVTVPINLKL